MYVFKALRSSKVTPLASSTFLQAFLVGRCGSCRASPRKHKNIASTTSTATSFNKCLRKPLQMMTLNGLWDDAPRFLKVVLRVTPCDLLNRLLTRGINFLWFFLPQRVINDRIVSCFMSSARAISALSCLRFAVCSSFEVCGGSSFFSTHLYIPVTK